MLRTRLGPACALLLSFFVLAPAAAAQSGEPGDSSPRYGRRPRARPRPRPQAPRLPMPACDIPAPVRPLRPQTPRPVVTPPGESRPGQLRRLRRARRAIRQRVRELQRRLVRVDARIEQLESQATPVPTRGSDQPAAQTASQGGLPLADSVD